MKWLKWLKKTVTRDAFQSKYANVFEGDEKWQGVETTEEKTYDWPASSTYVQNPPYFQGMSQEPGVYIRCKKCKSVSNFR